MTNSNKTQATTASAKSFIDSIEDQEQRKDCQKINSLMRKITGHKPLMWGDSMVGFGSYHYHYKSGRQGDYFLTGFSPRKENISIYIVCGFDRYKEELEKLGKHKTSVSCLYIKKLSDIDLEILAKIIQDSVKVMRALDKT